MSDFDYPVRTSRPLHQGRLLRLRLDRVGMPGGGEADREVLEHPGAVAVVAVDDTGRIALVEQYRHPVRQRLWELPAGLLDVAEEPAVAAARRELAEEAHLVAERWWLLLDLLTSPGFSDEAVRIYLARGLSPVPGERHAAEHEERELRLAWVELAEAVRLVERGQIRNAIAVAGILAAREASDQGWSRLRPADTPWRDRPAATPAPEPHG